MTVTGGKGGRKPQYTTWTGEGDPIEMIGLSFEIPVDALINCTADGHSKWKREFENRASRILRAGGSVSGGMSTVTDASLVMTHGPRHMVEGLRDFCAEFVAEWTAPNAN